MPLKVDGVDYSPEGIESLRQHLTMWRDTELKLNHFQESVTLTHCIALLGYLKEVTEQPEPVRTNPFEGKLKGR